MDKKLITEYVNRLNEEQKTAVTYENGSIFVLAAAGSGKTSTLTTRIAYLILEKEINPSNILAVTFTNKAAKEMIARLNKMGINTKELWIGTFHSLANKMLRQFYNLVGLNKNFTIMDSQEQESFLKRTLRAYGYETKNLNVSEILDKINLNKENGIRPESLDKNSLDYKYYSLYQIACKKDNCVDFGELLLSAYEIIKDNPKILELYSNKFEHILVDEFQDTNDLQYKWLKLLGSKYKNIFAVGDDDQSIYSFRGAKPENIKLLQKDFNAKIIKIEKNYRSDANILNIANKLIENNKNRQGKLLVPTKNSEHKILLMNAFNDIEEANFIGSEIKRLRRLGISYKNMAILYRTNSQSRSLEKALTAYNIPYIIFGGFRFFDRQEIKHAMAYLRLFYNKHDNMAFLRVANIPARAIGESTLKKLDVIAKENDCSLFDAIEYADSKMQQKFKPFLDCLSFIDNQTKKKNLSDIVQSIIINSGLENMYEYDKKEGPERLDNLYELISAAKVFENESKNINVDNQIEEFLSFCSLETDVNTEKKDENADVVKLMTVHASKGLEFEVVFISGLEETLFPHVNAIKDPEFIEEERRLMYVAITRAKKLLYMTYSEERFIHGNKQMMIQSRFLKEIPKQYTEKIK